MRAGLAAPYRALRSHITRWRLRTHGVDPGSIVLVQRRIYILPSRHGVIYMVALLLMLAGAVNYNLSLGFVLTFLLTSLGVTSILHTYRNLARLRISPARAEPVYAGSTAHFVMRIDNSTPLDRYSIGIAGEGGAAAYTDVLERRTATVAVAVGAPRRGILMPGRLTVFTQYPLGLCHAWAYVVPDVRCLVYPRPEAPRVTLPAPSAHTGSGIAHGIGQEDFSGLRTYHHGDSPRHIAWKAAARGQGLLTKQFAGRADSDVWLDWQATPDTLGVEGRLSRLARWVIDAHAAEQSFGLRLPGIALPPQPGAAQRDRCLEALALFQADARHA